MSAKDKQVGGGHYKDMPIQPIDFIVKNGLPFIEGCIVKYISRWRSKSGVEDLRKVIHYAELLIESELEHRLDTDSPGEFQDRCEPVVKCVPLGATTGPAPTANSFIPGICVPEGCDWPTEAQDGTRVLVWRPRKPGMSGAATYGWVEIGFMWDGQLVPHEVAG